MCDAKTLLIVPALVLVALAAGCSRTGERVAAGSQPCAGEDCIRFVYVHGAAREADGAREDFGEQVARVHEAMRSRLNATAEVRAGLLQDGRRGIAAEPAVYYWADQLRDNVEVVDGIMARIAQEMPSLWTGARIRLAHALHDMVWVDKREHFRLLHDGLHETLWSGPDGGRPAVLFGHSAGALLITSYIHHRARNIDARTLRTVFVHVSPELAEVAADYLREPTCVEALLDIELLTINDRGFLVARLDKSLAGAAAEAVAERDRIWRLEFERLPGRTAALCAPVGRIVGLVTFGSMVALLESYGDDAESRMFSLMIRDTYEQGRFWLNVNHGDDIVGFNVYGLEDLPARIGERLGSPVRPASGFVASSPPYNDGATLLSAHSWYLREPTGFAALVADTYAQGWRARPR